MPPVDEIPLLVVGCGSIGARHARNLRHLGTRELAVFDVDRKRADGLAAELDARAEPGLESALAGPHGIALVCSPPALHLEHARAAVDAGWDLLVEKPLAVSLEGVDELAAAAEARGLVTLVGFNLRFEPGLQHVRALLGGGTLGRALAVRGIVGQYLPDWHPWEDYRGGYSARRDLGGGALLDCSHEIDVLVWLFGDPDDVWCQSARVSSLEIETEDLAQLSLRFPEGPFAQLQLDYLQRAPRRELEIACEGGTIRWRYDERRLDVFTPDGGWKTTPLREDHNETYLDELRHLLDAAATRAPTVCDLREGARSLAVIERARA